MRVVSGSWRGRKLLAPAGDSLRPTTDRVKEALFSIIGGRVVDATVADLCCGAGCLGIEALSRGAARVDFVDVSQRALAATRHNLGICGAHPERISVVKEDAQRWLRRRNESGDLPDIILCDPPYATSVGSAVWSMLLVATAGEAPSLVVIEHSIETVLDIPADLPGEVDHRRYGETALTIWER